MVEVTAGAVFRAGGDQQHPDRWRHHRHRKGALVRQPAAHPGGPAALKQKTIAVVQQLPGQGEQGGGGLLGGGVFRLTGAEQQGIVHGNGEATARPRRHPRPGLEHVRRGLQRQGGAVEGLAPGDQVRLHPLGAIGQQRVRPHRPALQIPAQLLRLDRLERCDQPPALLTHHLRLAGAGGLINQASAGGGAAHAVLLMESEFAEFEHQLRHRLRPRLEHRRPVGGQAQAEGDKDVLEGGRGAAGTAAHRDVGGLFFKETLQHSKPGAIEGNGNDREWIPTSLALNLDSVLHLLPHPARLQRLRAHQHGQTRRSLNRCRDVTP